MSRIRAPLPGYVTTQWQEKTSPHGPPKLRLMRFVLINGAVSSTIPISGGKAYRARFAVLASLPRDTLGDVDVTAIVQTDRRLSYAIQTGAFIRSRQKVSSDPLTEATTLRILYLTHG